MATAISTYESLLALSDEDFRSVVDDAVRNPEDSRATLLRHPDVVARWYFTLVSMKKSVEGQLAAKKAEYAAAKATSPVAKRDQAGYERWRAGALRFKAGVENQLLEARLLREGNMDDQEVAMAVRERNRLIAAIAAHRDHDCDDDPQCTDDLCAADERLWASVSLNSLVSGTP